MRFCSTVQFFNYALLRIAITLTYQQPYCIKISFSYLPLKFFVYTNGRYLEFLFLSFVLVCFLKKIEFNISETKTSVLLASKLYISSIINKSVMYADSNRLNTMIKIKLQRVNSHFA